MHRIFLSADVLIQIACYLSNTSDRTAFATASRWCYFVLKKFIYTQVTLRPDGPAFAILPKLLNDPSLCTHITQLDVVLSTRPKYRTYVPGRDDIQQMWQQQAHFVQGVRTILKHTTQLNKLSIDVGNDREVLHTRLSLRLELGNFPFSLTSFKLGCFVPGTLEFIGAHPELNCLILAHLTNYPREPENLNLRFQVPSLGYMLPKLHTLWATPWWMRALLRRSAAHTFGLLHKSNPLEQRMQLILEVELTLAMSALVDGGGHPTVRCLALPLDDFIMQRQTLNMRFISRAFPLIKKLAVTVEPGQVFHSTVFLDAMQSQLGTQDADPIFQFAREFCFLLPGEWPHRNTNTLSNVVKRGKDLDYAIPHTLSRLMPGLVHIDTLDRCYSRVGAGVEHRGHDHTLDSLGGCDPISVFGPEIREGRLGGQHLANTHEGIVWFGRPRSECQSSQDWV